jgi:ABC-type multidrug transport system fused ATPase/permease subunit
MELEEDLLRHFAEISASAQALPLAIATGATDRLWRVVSIRANTDLADPALSRVVETAKLAHICDEIMSVPLLSDGGASLTSGQRLIVVQLSTIQDTDLVMDDGRIVEQGTHGALMALAGAAELIALMKRAEAAL